MKTGDDAWLNAMSAILVGGDDVSPRGMKTKEILHRQIVTVDLATPQVTIAERKLNYQFMAAEALWILRGDDLVEPLSKHVPRMASFSDDGIHLAGAYGPKIVKQLDWVVAQLLKDVDTRQAVLTIWERCPNPSKDIPCTVAMTFSIRRGLLFQHVYMRSSDAWLGLPYDMFSFSCVGIKVACEYNRQRDVRPSVGLGQLSISATSSHLYQQNVDAAEDVLNLSELSDYKWRRRVAPVPEDLVRAGSWDSLENDLKLVEAGASSGINWQVRP